MTIKYKHIKFRRYAGILIKGSTRVEIPIDTDQHMERAWYLTTQLESSKWGSVQSYDGAGISGGSLHNTAILPRNMKQGSLWKLLRRLEITTPFHALTYLWNTLREANFYVNRRGELCYYDRGGLVPAEVIRNELAPPDGTVPSSGPDWEKAKRWAHRFHMVLAHPYSFDAQREFAIEYMITGRQQEEAAAYGPHIDHVQAKVGTGPYDIRPAVDLAMAVYHSHSINGPSPALGALRTAVSVAKSENRPTLFAKRLIWELGTSDYGRWHDDRRGRNRYDRTRIKAMRSGLWSEAFFEGRDVLMPENLSGRREWEE